LNREIHQNQIDFEASLDEFTKNQSSKSKEKLHPYRLTPLRYLLQEKASIEFRLPRYPNTRSVSNPPIPFATISLNIRDFYWLSKIKSRFFHLLVVSEEVFPAPYPSRLPGDLPRAATHERTVSL